MKLYIQQHIIYKCALATLFLSGSFATFAQQYYNTPISQFFRNRYLLNPAFAGGNAKTNVYGLVNKSWIGFDGAPTLVQLSADSYLGKNAGLGVQLMSDKAGEVQRNLAKLSYSYKVRLGGEDEYIRMGISLVGYREQLSTAIMNEESADPVVKSYNNRGWRFDGDFGTYYHNKQFMFSAGLANLNRWSSNLLDKMPVNLETLHLTAAYIIETDENLKVQPLVSAKFYSKTPWLFRAGAEADYAGQFYVSLLWLNNNTLEAGASLKLGDKAEVNVYYGSASSQGVGQQLEVGLGVTW